MSVHAGRSESTELVLRASWEILTFDKRLVLSTFMYRLTQIPFYIYLELSSTFV